MDLIAPAKFWNTLPEDRAAAYPCDTYLAATTAGMLRAVNVDAPPDVLFRWLCQLKVAPYSYDWIDNLGRQSPRTLTAGAERLALGQRVMAIFTIVDFQADRHITLRAEGAAAALFGPTVVSYVVRPKARGRSRLVVKIALGIERSGLGWDMARAFLAWGDLIMMRKQLLTLKMLAERQARG